MIKDRNNCMISPLCPHVFNETILIQPFKFINDQPPNSGGQSRQVFYFFIEGACKVDYLVS